ncbi:Uncharacterized damage-inducible protein DinB (forms a four-helix bundle) [Chitinophaga ginsengisegetis]|uniref:Uncharacterized damage-inducible protein DinB (Forms a four-helix bundle) n=1 Tax=Chitinophaga ginsengisegetis TaxID=393003 RepID=A0A1T5NKW2_9BACT|nr:DinB family protein [Chitinophaga ginsengisegetis]SKD00778.1 Uncharacterized damage-inducible protein DinB (forms a four-helix bundle) [Chitinophaga ginsengisegetis]
MNLQNLVTNYAGYNLSVNQQFVNWLSRKSDEQLHQEAPSSFSSILKTLNHIWGMEEYWYSIICQKPDFVNRYGIEDLKREEVFQGLVNRSQILAEDIKSFSERDLVEKIKVVSPWFEANQSRYEYIQHFVNHGTYHRGQIVTIGRNIGITDAPGTDYLFFNLMKEQE